MSIVIKHTFLDVVGHTFLMMDEPCGTARRCHSVPREWKPAVPSRKRSMTPSDRSTAASPRSTCSFSTAAESLDSTSDSDNFETPRDADDCASSSDDLLSTDEAFVKGGACGCCGAEDSCLFFIHELACKSYAEEMLEGGAKSNQAWTCGCALNQPPATPIPQAHKSQELEKEPAASSEFAQVANAACTRTELKRHAPTFQPARDDTRVEAMANAANLVLTSCGQVQNIAIDIGAAGGASTSISAELQSGLEASTAYNVMHLARQALEAVVGRLQTTRLLSARIQKEKSGYSLRSSIVCLPDGVQDCLCWDLFETGHCPRRDKCQWYHPSDCDVAKIKISIRYDKKNTEAKSGACVAAKPSAQRHKLLLGELIR